MKTDCENSVQNLDNPSVLNSRMQTTKSSLNYDNVQAASVEENNVEAALGKLKNIRGQINHFYNVEAAITQSTKTSK